MNDFIVKTLGETVAFAKLAQDTIEKNKDVFSGHMSETDLNFSVQRGGGHVDAIAEYSKSKGIESQVISVSEEVSKHLESTRDLYLKDGDDLSVLRWWGFFGGASLVQWNMVKGVFESIEDDAMVSIAYDAIGYHEDLYDSVSGTLTELARKKSK